MCNTQYTFAVICGHVRAHSAHTSRTTTITHHTHSLPGCTATTFNLSPWVASYLLDLVPVDRSPYEKAENLVESSTPEAPGVFSSIDSYDTCQQILLMMG